MTIKQAGELDLTYGDQNDGLARIPPIPDLDPDAYTLLVNPSAWADDGSVVMYGHNPDDDDKENKVFIRMNADGHWDRATGHVPISKKQTVPMPRNFDNLTVLSHSTGKMEDGVIAAGAVNYFEGKTIYQDIVVGRYDERFSPWPGFGNDGIAITRPVGEPDDSRLADISAKAVDYRNTPKLALVAGLIRVVFKAVTYPETGSEYETTWCMAMDPATGEPAEALGPNGDKSRWELPSFDGNALTPHRVVFLDDGGFYLLGDAQTSMYLLRFNANAVWDRSFAGQDGYIKLPRRFRKFGLAIKDNLIVVSSGATPNTEVPSGTLLYGFDFQGQPVKSFEHTLTLPNGNLSLPHIAFDEQGRLVLAGERHFIAGSDPQINNELRMARLLADGSLDNRYGKDGFSEPVPYLWACNNLYISPLGIYVLTLMPVSDAPFYELIARFQS
ncbi:delta-60 repeat domain-containing protein [Pseudomonas sp. NBRC 111124]|uniref:delta-60 repeat domain-containing protein n=1 Tax=Pseudomonas sp. NBRC 111124 TaxID=1661039 RepID=UPI0007611E42|nr:delta-60 repeat domain-containing protein [Pseudomonas sp. NBRC 111124]